VESEATALPADPVVSVVLIVFNDRDRLPRALQSALSQHGPRVEVIVVDDGSTDGTAAVAAEWAARDDRVRVVTRAANSGGCGAPRNDGLEASAGRYVMFLDSDDELEAGAVAGLVAAAEHSGAEVVLGRASRHNEDVGSVVPWLPGLFQRFGVTTLAERPDLVTDTLVVDKLYRRDFIEAAGLRFPIDLHYEDLVFTAQMYAACRNLEVTDVPVYRWYVRALEGDRSITNRRAELNNLADRVEAHRRADAVLAAAGRDDLRVAKDRKFVDNDLALYLRDLPDRDAEFRQGLLAVLQPYVGSLRPQVRESSSQPGALVLSLIEQQDLHALVEASALAYRGRLARPLTRSERQWRWPGVPGAAGDVTPLVRRLTRLGLHLDHQVAGVRVDAAGVQLTVTTTDPLGLVRGPRSLRLAVLVRARGHSRSVRLARARGGGPGTTWSVTLPLGAALRSAPVPGEIQLRVAGWSRGRFALDPLFVEADTLRDLPEAPVRTFRNAGGYLGLTRTV